jgi:AraC-like DNA-binding protein
MAQSVTTVVIDDPHEITPTMWKLFRPTPTSAITPPQFLARNYRAGDWKRYKSERETYRTTASVAKLGRVCFVRMEDRQETDMVIRTPGLDHYCLTFLHEGAGSFCRPRASSTEIVSGGGVIFHGEPGTVVSTGRQSKKTNIWIPVGLLRRQAAEMLDTSDPGGLDFCVNIDTASAAGAGLRRLTEWLYDELAHPDSPLGNEMAFAAAQDLFLRTIVLAATHNRSTQLRAKVPAAAPVTVRRAEEFMRSSAETPLTIGDIAKAAGCSERALQAAFQTFRSVSPMAALRRIRLELAHRDIMASDGSNSVAAIANRYGFSNAGRFAGLYQLAFGEYPSRMKGSRPRR